MEQTAVGLEAIGESVVFLDHFKELPDPRQRGKITYPLGEVLLLCLLVGASSAPCRSRCADSAIGSRFGQRLP